MNRNYISKDRNSRNRPGTAYAPKCTERNFTQNSEQIPSKTSSYPLKEKKNHNKYLRLDDTIYVDENIQETTLKTKEGTRIRLNDFKLIDIHTLIVPISRMSQDDLESLFEYDVFYQYSLPDTVDEDEDQNDGEQVDIQIDTEQTKRAASDRLLKQHIIKYIQEKKGEDQFCTGVWNALKQNDKDTLFNARVTLSFAEVYKHFEEFTNTMIGKYLTDYSKKLTKKMWQQKTEEVFESNLQYEIYSKGDHDDFCTIIKLMTERPNEDILGSIAAIDNYENVFPVLYELIDGNQVLTNELIEILTRSDQNKAQAIYSLFQIWTSENYDEQALADAIKLITHIDNLPIILDLELSQPIDEDFYEYKYSTLNEQINFEDQQIGGFREEFINLFN